MGELCVPGCRYRQLYEGSQTSLADMAAKQAQSVNEHNQLRRALVSVLKRYFPREYQQAERSMGGRLIEAGDDVLAAYLDQLMAARHLDGHDVGLGGLKKALIDCGYQITGDDVDQWAEAVTAGRPAPQPTAVAPVRPDSSGPMRPTTTVPAAVAAAGGHSHGTDELDGSTNTHPASERPEQVAEPVVTAPVTQPQVAGDELDQLLAELDQQTPAAAPSTTASTTPPPADAGSWLDSLDDLFGDDPSITTSSGTPSNAFASSVDLGGLDDLFDDAPATASPTGTGATEITQQTPAVSLDSLDDLFGDGPSKVHAAEPPARVPEPAPHVTAPAAAPSLVDLFNEVPAVEIAPEPKLPTAMPLPLKPQTTPTKKRTGRRTVRTQAVRADVPEAASAADLDDRNRKALLAAVAIPRPVFVADLSAVAGSREVVEDWEAEMRELRTNAPVRFIGGKARHRMRGSLVIPHGSLRDASKEFTSSWWAECLERYRGAKLYELAVLLHRVGTEVISSEFDDDVVVLHLNDKRGLVGMAVVINDDFGENGTTSERLTKVVASLVRERLSLVSVLSSSNDWETAISQMIIEASRSQGWEINAPVVYANSWEWADDAGTTSKLLLGG